MGSAETEKGHRPDEAPQHRVTIAGPLAVGKFEVTFAEWEAYVAGTPDEEAPYVPLDRGWGRGNRPVINVSWQDAKRYVRWLNGRVGGRAYRLLTEAEWEYAARAGTTTEFSTGSNITPAQAQYNHMISYVGSPVLKTAPDRTAPVGSFPANRFGLHDLHGNVYEWVEDCYTGEFLGVFGRTSEACPNRSFRGGSWADSPWSLRSARREGGPAYVRVETLGFRVARTR